MAKARPPLSTVRVTETVPSAIPNTVASAMQLVTEEITAYLSSVEYVAGELFLKGIVFGDRKRRFNDGDRVCTSTIVTYEEHQGYQVARTLNSTYVVCDWAAEGARGGSKSLH